MRIALLSSVVLFTCAPMAPILSAATQTEAYENKTVGRIDVQMQNIPTGASFDPKAVEAKMNTKVGNPFSQLVFDGDLKTLSDEYDRVEPSIDVVNGEIYITLRVWPRPMITDIVWKGADKVSEKTLRKELKIKKGHVFNRYEFNKALGKVKEYYIKHGYFESQVSYSLQSDPKTNSVIIEIDVNEGRAGVIDDIKFKGFTDGEQSDILGMIYTKKYNLFVSWLTGTGLYNEEAVEQDKLTIINYFQNKGYADARVDITTEEAEAPGKINLVISVHRGLLFIFGKVTFQGNTLFSDADIEKRFTVRPDGVYSPEKLRNTAQAIKDLYGRKGYIDASVQYDTQLVTDAPVYNVHYQIDEGQEYKIGLIRVFGNVQTKAEVILHESLLIPGETFDSAKLKRTQERLENMGYFKAVNVYAVRTQDDQLLGDNYRDVYIEVEETTTGHLSLFFGLSSSDSIFGGLDLTETNFNIRGFGTMFKDGLSAFRGGGEFAHAKATLGSKQRSYVISWVTPYFRDTLWRVGFDTFLSQSKLTAKKYEVDSVGGSVFASYPINAYWQYGWKYRFKHAQIDVAHGATRKEKETSEGTGNVSATSASLSFDSTDSINKPHKGFRSYMEAEFAGLGGDFAFLKYTYLNTYYQNLWSRGIFKYRWDFKFIQPIWWTNKPEDIPVSERFFAGGENTVRGYKPYDIGEHFTNKNGETGDPMGGITYAVASLEYLHELFRIMDGFVFVDGGCVKLQKFHFGQFKMSAGFGVRLNVMANMPVTLGLGFPINEKNKDIIQKFFFSMGGQF